jgi:hypothetical protein
VLEEAGGAGGTAPPASFSLAAGTGGGGGSGGAGGRGQGYDGAFAAGATGSGGFGGSGGNILPGRFFRYPQYTENTVLDWYSGSGGTGGQGGTGGTGGNWGETGQNGYTGDTGNVGAASSSAIFLQIVNNTSSINYSASYTAAHTNNFIINGFGSIQRQGSGDDSGTIGATNAGLYGPVEGYDLNVGGRGSANGIYIQGTSSIWADDNNANGDDANDLVWDLDYQGGNVYFVYTSIAGTNGLGGLGGTGGASGGAAISGNNYSVSGIINANTLKGSYNT